MLTPHGTHPRLSSNHRMPSPRKLSSWRPGVPSQEQRPGALLHSEPRAPSPGAGKGQVALLTAAGQERRRRPWLSGDCPSIYPAWLSGLGLSLLTPRMRLCRPPPGGGTPSGTLGWAEGLRCSQGPGGRWTPCPEAAVCQTEAGGSRGCPGLPVPFGPPFERLPFLLIGKADTGTFPLLLQPPEACSTEAGSAGAGAQLSIWV